MWQISNLLINPRQQFLAARRDALHVSNISLASLLYAASGALSFFSVTSYVVIYPVDIAAAIIGLSVLVERGKYVRTFATIAALYLLYATCLLYFFHESELDRITRFVGLHGLTVCYVLAWYAFVKRSIYTSLLCMLGVTIGYSLQGFIFGSPQRLGEVGWNGGLAGAAQCLGIILGVGFVGIASRAGFALKSAAAGALTLGVAGLVVAALMESDRSASIMLTVSAIIALVCGLAKTSLLLAVSRRPLTTTVGGLVVVGSLVIGQYIAAVMGLLPSDVAQKIIDQWNHPSGYLVASRPDSMSAFLVAFQNPWLGIGVSSRDPEAIKIYATLVTKNTLDDVDVYWDRAEGYVPLHSVVAGEWARVGIVGLVVWTVVLIFMWRSCFLALTVERKVVSLILLTTVCVMYNIFFEPGVDRMLAGACLGAGLWVHQKKGGHYDAFAARSSPANRTAIRTGEAGWFHERMR